MGRRTQRHVVAEAGTLQKRLIERGLCSRVGGTVLHVAYHAHDGHDSADRVGILHREMHCPRQASTVGQYCRASVLLIRTILGASKWSDMASQRPARSGTPIARRYCGEAD